MRINATKLYEDNLPAIRSLASKFSSSSALTYDDVISEADERFMVCLGEWDEKRPFRSFWYTATRLRCIDLIRKRDPIIDPTECFKLRNTHMDMVPVLGLQFREMIEDMSKEAQYVTSLIVESPPECLDALSKPKLIRGGIKRHLISEGWTDWKIFRVFGEIRETLHAHC